MATFTSVQDGPWNDGATWGKTSPGTKGTDWPGLAGDVVNIGTTANQSHVVIYNVSETNQLGAITIGAATGSGTPRLDFSIAMNTKLTWADQDILIQATGELRVGGAGVLKVPSTYTAELVYAYNSAVDNTKGINIAAGGKLTVYGDPACYGSKYNYILATQVVIPAATNAVTVTITGNYQANFVGGQELLIHKGGGYASYINDFARLAVVSATNNGANTDISCTVTERPATLTCLVGADVLNVNQNVMFYKLGYNANLGQANTNRPRIANANVDGTNNININNVQFAGWFQFLVGFGVTTGNVVGRNGNSFFVIVKGGTHTNFIGFSSGSAAVLGPRGIIIAGTWFIFCSATYGITQLNFCRMASKTDVVNVFGCLLSGIYANNAISIKANIYSNTLGISYANFNCFNDGGTLGYNSAGIGCGNTKDIDFAAGVNAVLNNIKQLNSPPTISSRNISGSAGRFAFSSYQQVSGASYLIDAFGDLTKAGSGWTGTPLSGAASCLRMLNPQTNLSIWNQLDVIAFGKFRVWQKAGTVVYKVYIQSPTNDYAAGDLVFYADYISVASPLTMATQPSSEAISHTSNWTNYLSVSVTAAADGWVTLYLRLYNYIGNYSFYVDPGIWAGGNILMGDWSLGELIYPGPAYFGGGGNPALLPLGVMEVVN